MKTPKNSALRKMLKNHALGCSIRKHSDGENRHCSCGRDEAEKELDQILGWLRGVTTGYDIIEKRRRDQIVAYLNKVGNYENKDQEKHG